MGISSFLESVQALMIFRIRLQLQYSRARMLHTCPAWSVFSTIQSHQPNVGMMSSSRLLGVMRHLLEYRQDRYRVRGGDESSEV